MRDGFWFVFICALRFRRILASFYTNEILAVPGLCLAYPAYFHHWRSYAGVKDNIFDIFFFQKLQMSD